MLARAVLGLVFLLLAGFGLAFLFRPARMAAIVDIEAGSTTGWSDIRAVYGGLELGLAAVVLWCLLDPTRVGLGLGLTAAVFGFTAAGRGIGMMLDRPATSLTLKVFAVEAATAIVALLLAS